MNLDQWEEDLRNHKILEVGDTLRLLQYARDLLYEESNLQPVRLPVTICGDIHGQYPDLLHLFELAGGLQDPDNRYNYIFLGDLVDRGLNGVEVLTYLLVLKAKYPDRITLIRGNHETRRITFSYGFYDECLRKYGTIEVWRQCTELFDHMPISALIEGNMLCVHGGLSPEIRDLVWSDPEDIPTWAISSRGAGYLFGGSVVREFIHRNGLKFIARAHQLVQEGYRYYFGEKLLCTVWSAPNYCYRCNNMASVLRIDNQDSREFLVFKEVECQQVESPVQTDVPSPQVGAWARIDEGWGMRTPIPMQWACDLMFRIHVKGSYYLSSQEIAHSAKRDGLVYLGEEVSLKSGEILQEARTIDPRYDLLFTSGLESCHISFHSTMSTLPAAALPKKPLGLFLHSSGRHLSFISSGASSCCIRTQGLEMRPYPLKERSELSNGAASYTRGAPLPVKKEKVLPVESAVGHSVLDSTSEQPSVTTGVPATKNVESERMKNQFPEVVEEPLKEAEQHLMKEKETRVVEAEKNKQSEHVLSLEPFCTAVAGTPSGEVKAQRELTLFDLMSSSPKRQQQIGTGEGKRKREPARKESTKSKKGKTEGSKSIAKLAKASGKPIDHPAATSMSFLDDDGAECFDGTEDHLIQDEEKFLLEEPSLALDVQETRENDEIVLCDDTPPFVFGANVSGEKSEKKHNSETPPSSIRDANGLRMFFNPAVLKFQESFRRQVETSMKLVDGEYVCSEVVVYRSKENTNEVLSQEEYHRRSAEVAATAAAEAPQQEAASTSPSPKKQVAASRPAAAKRLTEAAAPVDSLFHYMNQLER
eukprot:gene4425-3224_t